MTRIVMIASSALLALLGAACLFAPEATAEALSLPSGAPELLPLVASGHLGFATVNWMGRGAIYGGIYGKPIVLGNWTHGLITTAWLVRWQLDAPSPSPWGWVAVGVVGAYAAVFTRLSFWPPYDQGTDATG